MATAAQGNRREQPAIKYEELRVEENGWLQTGFASACG
jgi:hypothetical protein